MQQDNDRNRQWQENFDLLNWFNFFFKKYIFKKFQRVYLIKNNFKLRTLIYSLKKKKKSILKKAVCSYYY